MYRLDQFSLTDLMIGVAVFTYPDGRAEVYRVVGSWYEGGVRHPLVHVYLPAAEKVLGPVRVRARVTADDVTVWYVGAAPAKRYGVKTRKVG